MKSIGTWLIQRGGLVCVAALVIYVVVAPSHLSTGDNAEFAALGKLGGAAHPPGYPLYVLWLRAWSWLPAGSPAHVSALATCVLGAATLLLLHAACRAWGAGALSASIAVAMIAAAPLAVRLHTEAEVFALNGAIVAAILWLAARTGPLVGIRRAAALGFLAGLGLANHHTSVLVAPIGLYGVIRGIRESERRVLAAAAAVGGLVLGLTPYLYLLAAPDSRASWGHVDGVGDLLHHFLREDYGGPSQLGAVDRGGTAIANLVALAQTLARSFLWLPLLGGLVVLARRCMQPQAADDEPRLGWILLAASFVLAGPLLVSRFNLAPEGNHAFITQRFHLLPAIVVAVPIAIALGHAGDWLAARVGSLRARPPWQGAVASTIIMSALIAVALPKIARARSPAIEQAVRNMLEPLPPGAVMIVTPDEVHFGMGYLQGAVHEREDVSVITWQLVGLPHVRERIARQLGVTIRELPDGSTQKLSAIVADEILRAGRPLYIDRFQANIASEFPVYPEGLLFRVLPRGSAVPSIDRIFEINQQLFERFRFGYEFPQRDDVVPAYYHTAYAETWRAIAAGLAREGKRERAETALQLARALAPIP